MANERTNNIKLGIFVLSGVAVLVLGLYLLGLKGDLFSRTIDVSARFGEVNGLREGNNVRYAGIDVGTVKAITIVSDTEVVVDMMVRRDAAAHIRLNAVASIASDGLMGNKLVSIEPLTGTSGPLIDGSVLNTSPGLDTDAMLRVLGTSNDNLVAITGDLRELTRKLNTEKGPVSLFTDTSIAKDMRAVVAELHSTAANASEITGRVNSLVQELQAGKGAFGLLLSDPTSEQQVRDLLGTLSSVSDTLQNVSGHISRFSQGLETPGGLGHTLTRDTSVARDLKRAVANMDSSAATLNEDLHALQRNWFFRKFFKEKKREEEKKKR